MNAERLLALYEKVAEAPDAGNRLRRFLLDLAVRGKLAPQDAGDEPALELLKRIAKEKARLVKAGEIKRPKSVDPVAAGEMAFAPPPGWNWTRLADIAVCLDYMRKPINGTERDRRIEGKSEDELFPYYGATQQQGWIDDYIFDEELVLLGEDGVPFFDPYRSKAYIISGKAWVNNHAHVFKGILISRPFLAHYLNVFDYTGRVVGATRSKLNQARAVDIPVPLPPLAEQHRIVAKVDELMALLDRLAAARTAREAARDRLTAASFARLTAPNADAPGAEPGVSLRTGAGLPSGSATNKDSFPANARFALATLPALTTRPDQIKPLRQTILNLAVRGKLVEQDPNDEPVTGSLAAISAKRDDMVRKKKLRREKPLNPVQGVDAPFQIPSSWQWVRVGELSLFTQYGTSAKAAPSEMGIPVLTMGNIQEGAVVRTNEKRIPETSDELPGLYLKDFDLLYNRTNSAELVGKTGLYRGDDDCLTFASYLIRIRLSADHTSPIYVNLAMNAPDFRETQIVPHIKKQTGQANVSGSALKNMLIPLPPLAEQHRIVAKVDALMALCDRLAAALATADSTRARLLEALLHEALEPAAEAVTEAAE